MTNEIKTVWQDAHTRLFDLNGTDLTRDEIDKIIELMPDTQFILVTWDSMENITNKQKNR